MFTGIIAELGTVRHVTCDGPGRRLAVAVAGADGLARGESIAVNGVCLTLVAHQDGVLSFDAGPETLERTNLGELEPGDRVNIERALRAGDRLGGHFVQGHVDGTARISERRRDGAWEFVTFEGAPECTDAMAPQGSVAVDGVSLTVVSVAAGRFQVMLIPHTLEHTTLGFKPVGARVNIESDILGKYVVEAVRRLGAKP
jgi:riboflavin synthase